MSGSAGTAVKFPPELDKRAEEIKKLYPDVRSAVMPVLYLAQEMTGVINQDVILWVAEKIGIAPVQVMEVATFYTMYYKQPVGKYHVQVCRTLSCALRGSCDITAHVHKRLNVAPGEITQDGMWSYEEVECLGSCGTAPMCEINDHYFENLTPEKLDEIMNRIEREKPDLRLSTKTDKLGEGLKGYTKSEVI